MSQRGWTVGVMCGMAAAGAWAVPGAAQAAVCQSGAVTFAPVRHEQCYTVPAGATGLSVVAVGGPGGPAGTGTTTGPGAAGGFGAQVSGTLGVTPGEMLYVEVGGAGGAGSVSPNGGAGGAGFNGGGGGGKAGSPGHAGSGGGGGASDVRTCPASARGCPGGGDTLASRLLVAAGGGGGGSTESSAGGAGGSSFGVDGDDGGPGGLAAGGGGGGGATTAAAGAAGVGGMCAVATTSAGGAGAVGLGGSGASGVGAGGGGGAGAGGGPGGGGGGGVIGGGGGGQGGCLTASGVLLGQGGGGGGAGSSLGPAGATFAADTTGVPLVKITPLLAAAQVAPSAPAAFATTPQGEISAPLTLTVSDTRNGPLSLSGLTFTDADPGDFIVGSDGCLGSVAPGASCQLTVNFTPQSQGARTATLDIASNDPNGPAAVTLSGTGGPLPQGPKGDPGSPGAAATIVCQNNLIAVILCDIEFAPGTFSFQGATAQANYTIRHAGRMVAHGRMTVRRGRITKQAIRRLRPGRYTVAITTGHGRHKRMLWKRTLRVA